VLQPFESQDIFKLKQDPNSIKFWDDEFRKVNDKKYFSYEKSFDINELKDEYQNYVKRIFLKNSKILLYLVTKIKIFNIFTDLKVYLHDQNFYIRISLFNGLNMINETTPDIKLHSNSLMFIFKNEFGFDTLSVNGNFESSKNSFITVTQHLAIGSLNAMGRSISFSSLFKPYIYLNFLKRLSRVKKKLI